MRRIRPTRPSPALVVAIVALVVACAGTATAAVVITSSSQIKNRTIAGADVRNSTLSGTQIRRGSIPLGDLSTGARRELQGVPTTGREVFRKSGPEQQGAGNALRTVATMRDVPPGAYVFTAKTLMRLDGSGTGSASSSHCRLDAGGDTDDSRNQVGGLSSIGPGSHFMQITRTTDKPIDVKLSCTAFSFTWTTTDATIIAVKLADAPRQAVDG
jgi:hypothetical protein